MEDRLRYGKPMLLRIFLPHILFLLVLASPWAGRLAAAAAALPQSGRVGCPHCNNDGSEISQLLHRADALYANFKTQAALK
ncbi:MAG: hypothetical protein ACREP8_08670, partial [Candidatus Binatia bacterium]